MWKKNNHEGSSHHPFTLRANPYMKLTRCFYPNSITNANMMYLGCLTRCCVSLNLCIRFAHSYVRVILCARVTARIFLFAHWTPTLIGCKRQLLLTHL